MPPHSPIEQRAKNPDILPWHSFNGESSSKPLQKVTGEHQHHAEQSSCKTHFRLQQSPQHMQTEQVIEGAVALSSRTSCPRHPRPASSVLRSYAQQRSNHNIDLGLIRGNVLLLLLKKPTSYWIRQAGKAASGEIANHVFTMKRMHTCAGKAF